MKAITESGLKLNLRDEHEIKRGGEGKILSLPELPGQVAKIYLNPDYKHMSRAQKEALQVLESPTFVKPLELILHPHKKSEVLGFTMDFLGPDFFPLSTLFSVNFCKRHQVGSSTKYAIARQLIRALAHAHQNQIVIGDLSGYNIMANLAGEVRFIDVDSYETPVHSHWGLQLDDIRDHLYQGKISEKSDYFALAVVLYNLLTHVHPFKGVHKKIKSLAERMIRKIPVFASDPDLIVPKCFVPIAQPSQQSQFARLFAQGERFLLDVTGTSHSPTKPVSPRPTSAQPTVAQIGSLRIQTLYTEAEAGSIRAVYSMGHQGYILTPSKLIVYNLSNRGQAQVIQKIPSPPGPLWLGKKELYYRDASHLYYLDGQGQFQRLSHVQFGPQAQFAQIGSFGIILDEGFMKRVYLDERIGDQVRVEQTPVFVPGFDLRQGVIQHAGGVQYLFYDSGQNISQVRSSHRIREYIQCAHLGIMAYEESNQDSISLHYRYFSLDNLRWNLSQASLEGLCRFAYQAVPGKSGIIFEPQDNRLRIREAQNFQVLQDLDCPVLSFDSELFHSPAGILAREKDFCYLINSN